VSSFVIEFNRRTGALNLEEFGPGDSRAAIERRLELESQHNDQDVEIVCLMSDSLETIRRTHRRYFRRDTMAA